MDCGKERNEEMLFSCATAGCQLTAVRAGATCCDFCPGAHTWTCLSRHSPEQRAAAQRRAQADGRAQADITQPSSASEERRGTSGGVRDDDLDARARSYSALWNQQSSSSSAAEHRLPEPVSAVLTVAAAAGFEDDVRAKARQEAYEDISKTQRQRAIDEHDRAFAGAGYGAKRPASSQQVEEARRRTAARTDMPVSRQWVVDRKGAFDEEQLKRMIVEMSSVNKSKWSHDTIEAATSGQRGSVQHVMASLARGPLSGDDLVAFKILDFGDADDPITPDWQNLEDSNVLPKIREAKARVYAEGSQPKLRTSLNHWMKYVATVAHVSFLRPRVGDDPDAFITESILRQGFVTWLVANGVGVETAEGYASLVNGWHIDTMGYGLVSSKSFDDEQYKRTKQGLRRMYPPKKLVRAGHQTELNEGLLRGGLEETLRIYDEPGRATPERWRRIEQSLAASSGEGLDYAKVTDLVYSALTELMTDGLLRPGEGVPKKGFISQKDVTFERDSEGRLQSATVMITPIKRRGKHVGDVSKRPIVIKAHRGGSLRTAELLEILNMVAPCAAGEEENTPAIRFPIAKLTGLSKRQKASLTNLTMRKVMKWYHERAARVPDHEHVKAHSFRIAGATLLFRAGVTADEIKTMGRWASDVYQIYCRLSKERLLELSSKMGNVRATQFINGSVGFFDSLLDFEPVELAQAPEVGDGQATAGGASEATEEFEETGDDRGESADSDSMSDSEMLRAIADHGRPAAGSIEALFEVADDDERS